MAAKIATAASKTEAARRRTTAKKEADTSVVESPRMSISLPSTVWTALEESAKKEGITKSEALRRATWVYLFLIDRLRAGCEVVIERPDGTSERVIFPY
jgi:hypothetical protein